MEVNSSYDRWISALYATHSQWVRDKAVKPHEMDSILVLFGLVLPIYYQYSAHPACLFPTIDILRANEYLGKYWRIVNKPAVDEIEDASRYNTATVSGTLHMMYRMLKLRSEVVSRVKTQPKLLNASVRRWCQEEDNKQEEEPDGDVVMVHDDKEEKDEEEEDVGVLDWQAFWDAELKLDQVTVLFVVLVLSLSASDSRCLCFCVCVCRTSTKTRTRHRENRYVFSLSFLSLVSPKVVLSLRRPTHRKRGCRT